MASGIDMANDGVLGGDSPVSTVQHGGSGTIEMYGGEGVSMGHTPVGSAQTGGKNSGSIDMEGGEGVSLSRTPSATFGAKYPSDKGE